MTKNSKLTRFKFPLMLITVFVSSLLFFAFESSKVTRNKRIRTDAQMVYIPGGSFFMGASDEQVDNNLMNHKKRVSISSFWMDRTEVTNEQYHRFVNYVADSLKYLAKAKQDIFFVDPLDTLTVNWSLVASINKSLARPASKQDQTKNENTFQQLWLPVADREFKNVFTIDNKKLFYRSTIVDLKRAALESNSFNGLKNDLRNYISYDTVYVYPDTLVWQRDFSYVYNEPLVKQYFTNPSFNDYPVVGVNWKQATAFCRWRTLHNDYYQGKPGKKDMFVEGIYRLPTEAEWEYAARGNSKINAMYPWGAPYTRTREGLLMANFKPGRGDYFGGDPNKDDITPLKVKSYTENGFGLYDMAGNVAEWTSSRYDEAVDNILGDFNPDYQYNVRNDDPAIMTRKSVRGGSWKDIAYNCQVSTRNYEYQLNAKSYIGFRCVLSAPKTK
jgi:formylglycine-generating enzyme required for sulfatase activity